VLSRPLDSDSAFAEVLVRAARQVRSPVIWCWGSRPVLLVPDHEEAGDIVDWPSVVCHDLAHWKRRDHLTALFAQFLVCAAPWQVLLWLVRHRLIELSEEACDDWVIASGQVSTRYARTLLGLAPQDHAALVPAVVSAKRGLAGRVRRIIANRCANPRSGLKWSIAAAILASALALSIAFAQTGRAEPAVATRTRLADDAVIEQLSPTDVIRGVILDPNDEPAYHARAVVLPMTMCGVQIASDDEKAAFGLPWSPTWFDEGQNPWLVAVGRDQRNEAAMVEVTDPTAPLTIHLKPAVTVTGQVVDPNGRLLQSHVTLLLTRVFRCRTVIHSTWQFPDSHERFTLSKIPRGQTYEIEIAAYGFQTVRLVLDTTDQTKNLIDVGTITMQPQKPGDDVAEKEESSPGLEEEFRRTYGLEEGEVIKLIKPPFVLGRDPYIRPMLGEDLFLDTSRASYQSFGFRWDGEFKGVSATTGRLTLSFVLPLMLNLPSYDFDLSDELWHVPLPRCDWVVRDTSGPAEKLKALETILRAELKRPIRFEEREVERDTIVVSGRYAFTPLSEESPDRLCLYVGTQSRLANDETDSIGDLLPWMGRRIGIPVEDRSEQTPTGGKVRYVYDGDLLSIFRSKPIADPDLSTLLANLAKQTNLTFTVEKQPHEVWFAVEEGAAGGDNSAGPS
jgi:hypothetical protein